MPESKLLGLNVVDSLVPSSRLLRAAVSGLLALGAGACGDDDSSEDHGHDAELTDDEVDALCKDKVDDAVDKAIADQDVKQLCSDMVADAKKDAQDACKPDDSDLPKLCGDMVTTARAELEASVSDLQDKVKTLEDQVAAGEDEVAALKEKARPLLLTTEEKTISAEQKEYTFAALTNMCDDRAGYTQVHAACGGHNACAGFSYGDWGPGAATLFEHSCAGANSCLGLSCVVLPDDAGHTGKEIYEDLEFGDLGPNACIHCHADLTDPDNPDTSKFVVYKFADSTRTVDNWLDRTAAEQERVVAFGAHGVLPDGTAYDNMAAYHGVLSRAEVERVVEHIRTLDPVMWTTKTKDP